MRDMTFSTPMMHTVHTACIRLSTYSTSLPLSKSKREKLMQNNKVSAISPITFLSIPIVFYPYLCH